MSEEERECIAAAYVFLMLHTKYNDEAGEYIRMLRDGLMTVDEAKGRIIECQVNIINGLVQY